MLSDLASGGWLKRELCRIHSDTETAETVVDDALKALIVNMSEAGRLDLQTGLQKVLDMFPEGLRVGTACSGTDIAVVGMKHTARALKEVFPEMDLLKVSHLWSCELEEFKNEFIQRNFDVSAVYSDMAGLSAAAALNLRTACEKPIGAVDLFVCGFSCKDFSTLNTAHLCPVDPGSSGNGTTKPKQARKTSLMTGSGTSSRTFMHTGAYLKAHHPPMFILENVPQILNADDSAGHDVPGDDGGEQQHIVKGLDVLNSFFADLGYALHVQKQNAFDSGTPQLRHRVYMIGMRMDLVPDGDSAAFLSVIADTYSTFRRVMPAPLESYLLSMDEIEEWRRNAVQKQRRRAGGSTEGKWTPLHAETYRSKGLQWPPSTQALQSVCGAAYTGDNATDVFQLSRREAEIVFYLDKVSPSPDASIAEEAMDVSQNIDRVHVGHDKVYCLTPGQRVFLRRRRRLLLGEEALRLQGLWRGDARALRTSSDAQLSDLAGNAFCITSFCSAFLCLISSWGRLGS